MNNKKTVIITGGNSGLGFKCAGNIAVNLDYRVILACRDMQKAELAKADLIKTTGNPNILAMELDVSSLQSVRSFVSRYKKEDGTPIYALVCNAGINGMNTGQTPEGFDVVFATNHLGHFLLTNLLLPVMLPSGRVSVVSSDMHCPPGPDLVWPGTMALVYPDGQLNDSFKRYSFSKLCNLYFTYELSRRLEHIDSSITANALNPGLMTDTNFAPNKSRFTPEFLQQVWDRIGSLEQSANALAHMVTDPSLDTMTGNYFDRGINPKESSPLSYNSENALNLWNTSVTLTKLEQNETLLGLI